MRNNHHPSPSKPPLGAALPRAACCVFLLACSTAPASPDADASTDAAACPDARPGCYWLHCGDPFVPGLTCVDGAWVCDRGATDPSQGCPCPVVGPDPPPYCYNCDGGRVGEWSCNSATRAWECADGGYTTRDAPACTADAGAD